MGVLVFCFIVFIPFMLVFISSKISVYGWHRPWTWWYKEPLLYVNKGWIHSLFFNPRTFYQFIYRMKIRSLSNRDAYFADEEELAAAICKHRKIPEWIDQVCTKEQYQLFIESGK